MSYIGNSPGVASKRIVNNFTATSGQTTFTPSTNYAVGYIDVYVNGVRLVAGSDYVASNGTTVVLSEACVVDDRVDLIVYVPRTLTNMYTIEEVNNLFQPLDADLTSIAALAGTSGFLKKTAANTWQLDTNNYLTSFTEADTLATVTGRGASTGSAVTITNSTASTNTTTGALIVSGGVGIGGTLSAPGFSAKGDSTFVSISGYLTVGSYLTVASTTGATSTTTGALVVSGGVGVSGSLYANAIVATTTINDSLGNVRDAPKSGTTKTSQYTLVAGDKGSLIEVGSGGSIVVNNNVFTTGNMVTIYNNTAGNITLTMNITTAYIGGTNTDKDSITVATRGLATILFTSATECVVNGQVS